MAQKYLFIAILSVKMSRVNKALSLIIFFYITLKICFDFEEQASIPPYNTQSVNFINVKRANFSYKFFDKAKT